MPRQTKQELEDEIIDGAAALFARHGFAETSIQRVADAVGYSKTGLLHRYATKEILQQAVLRRCVDEIRAVSAAVADLPPGPGRDAAAIEALVDLTLRRPGIIALLLSIVSHPEDEGVGSHLDDVGHAAFAAFATDLDGDPARVVRVVGALGALAIAAVVCRERPPAEARSLLFAVSYDALGH